MIEHFADRLAAACRAKGNALCVGLDPRWQQLPAEIRERHRGANSDAADADSVAAAFAEFCLRVLDIAAPLVPIVKPQSAFFEACGPPGLAALQQVLARARHLGLLTILDSKRNDIASTGQAYADAVFGPRAVWPADAMTINPYLGRDAVEPFLRAARSVGGALYILVRTSNAGAGLFQDLESGGKPLYRHVGEAVAKWADENRGVSGFGDVGAVVGATHVQELAQLRTLLSSVPFLVPGYGAQGAGAADTAPAFRDDGLGAIINSSRGIIASFAPDATDWEEAVARAIHTSVAELKQKTSMAKLRDR